MSTYGIIACKPGQVLRYARMLCPSTLEFIWKLRRHGWAVTILPRVRS